MTDQQQKALRLLGLARRARLLEIGEEPVGIVCRSGKAKLLLVAKDAGDHTFRRARSFVSGSKCPYICAPYTKDELGNGLGCNACALCAFTDPAFAKSFLEALGDPEHDEILTHRADAARPEAPAGGAGAQKECQNREEITGGGCIEY